MRDDLGTRMKENYENRTRFLLPRRTYTIIRIDGKAFHTYTKGCERPFDLDLIDDMDATARYLCANIQGAKFAYVQSDEISILVTDFDQLNTSAWFDNNVQKMASVSASLATAKFNQLRANRELRVNGVNPCEMVGEFPNHEYKLAHFDARVFQIPTKSEVANYFIWRQKDCIRNSVSSVGQSLYSPKELNGKSTETVKLMIAQKQHDWDAYPNNLKHGRIVEKSTVPVKYDDTNRIFIFAPEFATDKREAPVRTEWFTDITVPVFVENKEYLLSRIPDND